MSPAISAKSHSTEESIQKGPARSMYLTLKVIGQTLSATSEFRMSATDHIDFVRTKKIAARLTPFLGFRGAIQTASRTFPIYLKSCPPK